MAKKNHYLEMLEHIEQTAPELSALLDKYTEQYDDADPDDYGTPAEARALAVDLIGQYIRQLTAYLEELKAEPPKARAKRRKKAKPDHWAIPDAWEKEAKEPYTWKPADTDAWNKLHDPLNFD